MLRLNVTVPESAVCEETYCPLEALASDATCMGATTEPDSASAKSVRVGGVPSVTLKARVTLLFWAWPSLTVTVIVTFPLAPAAGVKAREPVGLGLV
jgi:hypothetical protein